MNAIYNHAWMQKHPTPTNGSGDFHWHPDTLPSAIRATLTELATRGRGRPASIWIIDSRYVAWARTFTAVAPSDRRRYTGLAATIGQPEGPSASENPGRDSGQNASRKVDPLEPPSPWSADLPGLFTHMPLPEARPFATGQALGASQTRPAHPDAMPTPVAPDTLRELFDDRDPDVAGAVYHGGQAYTRGAHDNRLPKVFGQMLSWIPAADRSQPRTGMFTENRAVVERPERDRATDNLLHYLSAAWMCPAVIHRARPDYGRTVWHLVGELAASSGRSMPEVFAELTEVALSWDDAAQLLAFLRRQDLFSHADLDDCDRRAPSPLMAPSAADAGWLWNRLLHYWGRGFLTGVTPVQLARVLALRVVADHLFHLDAPSQRDLPERYLRRLRYEALLPRERVQDLHEALGRCIPSVSPTREVQLG